MFKRVIITGSSGLIGKHITKLLSESYEVIPVDLPNYDLTNEKTVVDLFREVHAENLINLFAFNDHVSLGEKRSTLFDLPIQSFRDCLEVNLTALFHVCREFARNNDKSNIVNFGASTGIVSARTDLYDGAHKHVGYSVSKAGVIHMTKILATHLAPNIRVNCISPGGIEANQSSEFKDLYSSHTPLNRMMNLSDLDPIIMMLLDDKNSYMTGANIVVDGGWTAL